MINKKSNFANIQATHVVPTEGADVYPITTGFEKVLAHRSRPPFAYAAKQNGVITSINKETGIITVTYKDGTVEAIKTGDNISRNSGGGFDIRQHMELNGFEKGDKFRAGDILAYNNEFFRPVPGSKQVSATIGITANVALVEDNVTLEDSSSISKAVADRLTFRPIYERDVVLSPRTTVHSIAMPGTAVSNIDPLMIFDEADVPEGLAAKADDSLLAMLADLNKSTPRAKHDGTVVRVEVFYNCARENMTKSVQEMIDAIDTIRNKESRAAKKARNKHQFLPGGPLEKTNKVGTTELNNDTIVIRFYIEHASHMGGGSKIIFSSSLKSVDAEVHPTPITGYDDGIIVDARTSFRSVNNRIVFGVIQTGTAARVMDKLQQECIDIFFDT